MNSKRHNKGTIIVEILVAMSILVFVMIPLSFSFVGERQEFNTYLHRAVAMEIVDGEMEILRAGEWRAFHEGTQAYEVKNPAATNLPPGKFELTMQSKHIRLNWTPDSRKRDGVVSREIDLP